MWAKSMGGAFQYQGLSIALDDSGNVYTTGRFQSTVDFDPGGSIFNMTSAGSDDIFVSKLDPLGNFVWAKRMGGTFDDWSFSIAVDGSGNVYTTGAFEFTADFDPGASIFTLTSAAFYDIFVSKLDALGNFVWAKQMGGISLDMARSIAVDGFGNVYTTGYFSGIADFDPGPSIFNMTSVLGDDIFVSKLDLLGNFLWAKQMSEGFCNGHSIALDDSGNVYTTGIFLGTVDFDPGPGGANVFWMTSAGGIDIFVSKLDADGNFVWAKQIGGTLNDWGNSIALDDSGNIYTTGTFQGTADFDPGASPADTFNMTSAGGVDIFVSKLDLLGNFVWAIGMGGAGNEEEWSIALDASANVYIIGDFYSATLDLDPDVVGVYNVSNTGLEANFIAQYDNSGNFLCAFSITPGHNEAAHFSNRSIAVAGSNIYITAAFNSASTDFDPCPPVINLPYSSGLDIYVAKYDMSNCNCVPPLPIANFTASDTMICEDSCINFTDLSTGTPTSWQWSFPGAIPSTATSQNPTNICYDTAGTYDVTLIAANTNGSDTLTKILYIVVYPSPTVDLGNDTAICAGDSLILDAGNPGFNYNWSTGDTIQTISVDTSGIYWVTVSDTSGTCQDIDSIILTVIDSIVAVITPDTGICEGDNIQLNASGGVNYVWSPSTGLSNTSIANPIANPILTTTYQVIVSGCGIPDTAQVTITVTSYPIVNIGKDTTICSKDSVILDAGNPGANYLWSTGATTQTITVSTAGQYSVQVTDSNDCTSSDNINIKVDVCEENILFIPNSFSPNGDGDNDILFVRGSGIKNVKLFIYNRWGEKVFESWSLLSKYDIIKKGWDGTYRGKPLNTAIFAWYAEVEFEDGNKIYRKGNVTLIR